MKFLFFLLLSSCNILGSPSTRSPDSLDRDTTVEDAPPQDFGFDQSVEKDLGSSCGDDHLSPSEICEGFDLRGKTCETEGFSSGQLSCNADCSFDFSGCIYCGDGEVQSGEACDTTNLAQQTCENLNLGTGSLKCSPNCELDLSGCRKSFVEIGSGEMHSCGLTNEGGILCWGGNDSLQVEDTPTEKGFKQVAVGKDHNCAIKSDGQIICWGNNSDGQKDHPPGKFKALSLGYQVSCGIREDDFLICWGSGSYQQLDSVPQEKIRTVSAGVRHICVITFDDLPYCWGRNDFGEGMVPFVNETFSQVEAGWSFNCGLAGSEIKCWGDNGNGILRPPVQAFSSISVGDFHSCAIDLNQQITCWGSQSDGKSTPPAGRFKSVSAGSKHTCAIDFEGEVQCWGSNAFTQRTPPILNP